MTVRSLTLAMLIAVSFAWCPAVLANPAAAARYYEDGLARFDSGDVAGAIIQLKNALQEDRNMLAAQLLLAQAYLQQDEVGPAEVAFLEALRLGVDRSEVAVPLARIYLARGKPAELIARVPADGLPDSVAHEVLALRGVAHAAVGDLQASRASFERARALRPEALMPLIDEVPVLIGSGNLEEATQRAERAVMLGPQDPAAWNAAASVRHAAGDLEGALTRYAKAIEFETDYVDARIARAGALIDLGRDADAQRDLDYLHEHDKRDPRATYLRALLASRAGDQAAAAAFLGEVAGQVDSLPAEWLAWREQLLMLGALSHHALGNAAQARNYLDVVAARFPNNIGARRLLAAVMVESSDFERAQRLLEPIVRAYPDDVQARSLLGRVYFAQKRFAQAETQLAHAVELGSGGDTGAQATLGLSRLAAGEPRLARLNLEAAVAARPADSGLVSTLAALYLRQGEPDAAIDVAESLVSKLGTSALAHNLLGVARAAGGDIDGARAAYKEALRADPGFRPARLNLVRLDVAQRRFDDARTALEALLASSRQDDVAMFELGVLEFEAGRPEKAAEWFEKAVLQNPAAVRAGILLVDAHLASGSAGLALDAAKAVVARHARDPAAIAALARAQLALGDRSGAQLTLRELSRSAEASPAVQTRIGALQLAAGLAEDAAFTAHKVLAARPDDANALILATEVALTRGHVDEGAQYLGELARHHPDAQPLARLSGELALAREDFAAADRHFARALAVTPDASLMLRRVQVLTRAGKLAAAIEACGEWLAERPADVAVRGALAELRMMEGEWGAARDEYVRIIEAGGGSAAIHNNLANVLDRLGDPGAVGHARKAHALDPANPFVIDTLGWLLARNGQLDEALRYLRDARLRSPENPEIRYHLAHALEQAGSPDLARRELEPALIPGAAFEGRAQAEALLARLQRGR